MPVITLPDGNQKVFDQPVSVADIAASTGRALRKLRWPARSMVIWSTPRRWSITTGPAGCIVTDKDPDGLSIIRHSTAHLLAKAVQELFPGAQVTIGPVIEDGFYYDFACRFRAYDLASIEKRMAEIAARDVKVHRRLLPRDEAVEHFKRIGEHYKAEIIGAIPAGEPISLPVLGTCGPRQRSSQSPCPYRLIGSPAGMAPMISAL